MNLMERFFSAAKRISLEESERETVRTFLKKSTSRPVRAGAQDGLQGMMNTSFIAAARSVRAGADNLARVRATLADYTTSYVPPRQRRFLLLKRSFAAFGAMLVFGSTVCAAAESSVPGDTLYPVKTAVNEPILETWASLTPADRARWKVTQVNRRLQEMALLSDRKALTPEREEKLTRKIDERTQQALTQIDALEAAGQAGSSAEIRASLGKTLRKNEKLLMRLEQSRPALRQRLEKKEGSGDGEEQRSKLLKILLQKNVEGNDGQSLKKEGRVSPSGNGFLKRLRNPTGSTAR